MKLTTYTPEFRAAAAKLVLAQGLTLEEAAKRITIPKWTLANWVSAAKRGSDPTAPPGSRDVVELEAEVAKLRKELAVERMEKEVLKSRPTRFVMLCQQLDLFSDAVIAFDGSKFKAVNSSDRNLTAAALKRRMPEIEANIGRYLAELDTADRQEPVTA